MSLSTIGVKHQTWLQVARVALTLYLAHMSTQSVTIPDRPWVPTGPKTFGDRIRQIRIDLRMDVQTIAALCDLPKNSWLNWEKGHKPRDLVAVCQKISGATNADFMWLLTGQTNAVSPKQQLTILNSRENCLAA